MEVFELVWDVLLSMFYFLHQPFFVGLDYFFTFSWVDPCSLSCSFSFARSFF